MLKMWIERFSSRKTIKNEKYKFHSCHLEPMCFVTIIILEKVYRNIKISCFYLGGSSCVLRTQTFKKAGPKFYENSQEYTKCFCKIFLKCLWMSWFLIKILLREYTKDFAFFLGGYVKTYLSIKCHLLRNPHKHQKRTFSRNICSLKEL